MGVRLRSTAAGFVTLAAMLLLRLALAPVLKDQAPLLPLLLGSVVAALYGGWWPGVGVTLAGTLSGAFFIIAPHGDVSAVSTPDRARLVLFTLLGLAVAALGESQLRSKRRAEELMQQLGSSERLLRKLLDSLFAFAGVMTKDGVLLQANRAALEAASIEPVDVIGKPFEETYWWSWSPAVQRQLRDAIKRAAAGENVRYDVQIRVAEDRLITIDFMISPMREENGKIEYLVPSAVDVTQRKQVEAALRASESKMRRFFESSLVGVIFSDAYGRIVDANDEFLRIVGRSRQELDAGLIRWSEMTPPEHTARDEAAIMECAVRGACTPYEKVYIRSDGVQVPIIIGYALMEGSNDQYVGFILDIAERKSAERSLMAAKDEAEAANRAKDEFMAVVSHELRTPMTTLLGWLQMMQSGLVTPDEMPEALGRMEQSARSEMRLIEDILDVSRLINGKLRLQPSRFDLARVVRNQCEAVGSQASQRALTIRSDLPASLEIIGDADRLRQVVANLLNNAVKFSYPGGAVIVSMKKDDAIVELSIADRGVGIEPRLLAMIFDRFQQADSTVTRKHGGLGLGLAIARELVEAHGGTISAASDGRDKGATFTVRLPLA